MMEKKDIKVVAAVILRGDEIFVSQRGYGEFKDFWEFPGGKIKEGETPQEALKREIKEELDADIEVDSFLKEIYYEYSSFNLDMKIYFCHLLKPHLELLEHENALWIHKDKLDEIGFLPADKLLIPSLKDAL